jgi:hypothetical protein
LKRRYEISGGEADVIVANSCIQQKQPAGTLAEFGGLACRLDLNGAESVGANTSQQLAVRRLRNVEAIELGHCLIGLCTSDVRLSIYVLHDTGDEVEYVAIVVCGGIRDIEDIESTEGFLRSNLGGIDGGRGLDDIDDLSYLLLMGESHIDVCRDACLGHRPRS